MDGVTLVVVDNYDSFTFNVVDLLCALGASCDVVPNDASALDGLLAIPCDGYVVSPGPCDPDRAGVSLSLFRAALDGAVRRPVLGVCLGHQALAQAAGGRVVRGARPVHGKTARIRHDGRGMFRRAPPDFVAAQYNSLVVDAQTVPACLEVAATSLPHGEVMALRHRSLPLASVQFHPESHMSEAGGLLFGAWLDDVRASRPTAAIR